MSLLGEEVVEEWLNRNGFFTIRGIKVGIHEMDILAVRPLPGGKWECRHIECQLSSNPISYITKVPVDIRKQTGITPYSARRRDEEQLKQCVREWIQNKYDLPHKAELKNTLCPGSWSRELVVGSVKYEEELDLFREEGITIHRLRDVLSEMTERRGAVKAAAGANLIELMLLTK